MSKEMGHQNTRISCAANSSVIYRIFRISRKQNLILSPRLVGALVFLFATCISEGQILRELLKFGIVNPFIAPKLFGGSTGRRK